MKAMLVAPENRRPRSSSRRPLQDPGVKLMLRVKRDEPGAFAELLDLYGHRVFGLLWRWLPDRQEAEDMAQEVFLRLFRARRRYKPRARFETWLFLIARNVARNALRRRRRHPCVPLDNMPAESQGPAPASQRLEITEQPWRALEQRELARAVRSAISDLGGRQRQALELHQFHDHTYAEVAATMALTTKAAKSLLYRARNQLRISLLPIVEA